MNKKEQGFIKTVWKYYREHGRQNLPWRNLPAPARPAGGGRQGLNPYRILVSEIMLQQTQVDRVIPKYKAFLKQFPTVEELAEAPLGDVLRAWQGLGYNRRARMLHECAKEVVSKHKGKFPRTHAELVKLPGIGHYTAGAVLAFAYNIPIPIIETNIRSAFLHHFFNDDTDVSDSDISRLIAICLDEKNPREWYWALMDYGAHIKKKYGNPNSRSKHYTKQSSFKGSDRQIRGMILKNLSEKNMSRAQFHKELPFEIDRIDAQLEKLEKEGMVSRRKGVYALPN